MSCDARFAYETGFNCFVKILHPHQALHNELMHVFIIASHLV